MGSAVRFRSNSPNVVHEVFDDEVVVVNLDTGRYFSLRDASARLWNLAIEGATVQDMTAWFAACHTTPAADIERDIEGLMQTLIEHQLLVPASDERVFTAPATPTKANDLFTLPPLQVFTDMQDLLLLDPIHEVDEGGWPLAKPQTDSPR
ncbi:MAG: PqqD family protein [Vicinamibacterales bacterium]